MADSNHKVAIVVAVIGVTGTLGAALLANWDKIFGRAPPAAAAAPAVLPAPAAATPAATPAVAPAATPTAKPAAVPSLTGDWRDSTGPNNISRVRQTGNSFQYARQGSLANGTGFDATGSGTLDGQQLVSSYQARYANGAASSGTCSGSVSADATRMELQCVDSLLGAFSSVAVKQ